ncbi:MAG: mannose-1-phosphate guanylyltransferase [Ignavibacteriaceae bacterium]|nr:mannose-1-phosphate guanylyltransferase [Ignavibacteriaceae bacterium]
MKIFAIIMAGGVGSRFWPKSREKNPKQLLKMFGDRTLIQQTVDRLKGIVDSNDIFIITNSSLTEKIAEQLPEIPGCNIIAEPFGRNTAPCIALGALIAKKISPDSVSIVLPADHLIKDEEIFRKTLTEAANYAYEKNGLVTIGIPPNRPETGYGYIQVKECIKINEDIEFYGVETFAEKPNYATALRFLHSGDFLWNSGMFIWRNDVILDEIMINLPELYNEIIKLEPVLFTEKFESTLESVYSKVKSVSIDYGVMEKSNNVYLVKGKFIWNDVGSWDEVYRLSELDEKRNALDGNVFTETSHDCYVYSPDKFTALLGVDNLIVINTNDALLICRRDQSQEVKKVVEFLKMNKNSDLL